MKKVLNLYKKEGETPLETIEQFKKENPEYKDSKITYAGRLDPMAEGVLLVLVGEECKNKEKYLKLDKEYEFEILWGFQTDTYDILGIPEHSNIPRNVGMLEKMKGKIKMEYPSYSSMTVEGKQLWEWAKENRLNEIKIPEIETEIYDIKLLENYEISKSELEKNILERISKVEGDFRQEEISKKWKDTFLHSAEHKNEKFWISKIKIKCSSGTYVRSIANKSGGLAYSIKRLKVGDYEI